MPRGLFVQAARAGGQRGFTLLEVIVALIIMGMILGAAFETFSTGLRNAGTVGGYSGAVVRAEGKLALLGVAERLEEGVTSGRFDGDYTWRLDVRPVARHEGEIAGPEAHVLYRVALTVFWGDGRKSRQLTLVGHRLTGLDRS